MPAPFTLADLSPDVLGMSPQEFARLRSELPREKFEIVAIEALVEASKQARDRVPLLADAVTTLDDASLVAFLVKHQNYLKQALPADVPALARRLFALVRALPERPAEFSDRIDFLVNWQDRLPRVTGPEALTRWRRVRTELREWARERERSSGGLLSRMKRGLAGGGSGTELSPELLKLATALKEAMPQAEYPDADGTRKANALAALAAVYAKTAAPFDVDTLNKLRQSFIPPRPVASQPTPSQPAAQARVSSASQSAAQAKISAPSTPPQSAVVTSGAQQTGRTNPPAAATSRPTLNITGTVVVSQQQVAAATTASVPSPPPVASTTAGPAGATAISTASPSREKLILAGAAVAAVVVLGVVGFAVGNYFVSDPGKDDRRVARERMDDDDAAIVARIDATTPTAPVATANSGNTPPPVGTTPRTNTPAVDWQARLDKLKADRAALEDRLANTQALRTAQAELDKAHQKIVDLESAIIGLREQAAAEKPAKAKVDLKRDELEAAQAVIANAKATLSTELAGVPTIVDPLQTDLERLIAEISRTQDDLTASTSNPNGRRESFRELHREAKEQLDTFAALKAASDRHDTSIAELVTKATANLTELDRISAAMDPLPALTTADGRGRYEVLHVRSLPTSGAEVETICQWDWKIPPDEYRLFLHRPKLAGNDVLPIISVGEFKVEADVGRLPVFYGAPPNTQRAEFQLRTSDDEYELNVAWDGNSGGPMEAKSFYGILSQHTLEFWTADGSWYVVLHPPYEIPAWERPQSTPGDRSGTVALQLRPDHRRHPTELKFAGGEVLIDGITPIDRDRLSGVGDKKINTANPNFRWEIARPEMGTFSVVPAGEHLTIVNLAAATEIAEKAKQKLVLAVATDTNVTLKKTRQELVFGGKDGKTPQIDPATGKQQVRTVEYEEKLPQKINELREVDQFRPRIALIESELKMGFAKPALSLATVPEQPTITFTPQFKAKVYWPNDVIPSSVVTSLPDGKSPPPEVYAQALMVTLANSQAQNLPSWIKERIKSFSGVLYYELDDGTPIEYVRFGQTATPVVLPLKATAPAAPAAATASLPPSTSAPTPSTSSPMPVPSGQQPAASSGRVPLRFQ